MKAVQSPPTIDPHIHEGYEVTSSLGEGRSYVLVLKHAEIITLLLIRLCSAMTLRIRDERYIMSFVFTAQGRHHPRCQQDQVWTLETLNKSTSVYKTITHSNVASIRLHYKLLPFCKLQEKLQFCNLCVWLSKHCSCSFFENYKEQWAQHNSQFNVNQP